MLFQFIFGIERDEAGVLPIQVKDGVGGDTIGFEHRRGGKVINRRIFSDHCAGPDDERIKVDGEYTVDFFFTEQLCQCQVCPVDFRLFYMPV